MELILLLAVILGSANAQEHLETLETITVTAERFPVKEKESSRFVTVVSTEKLKETGANNVVDALKRIGGFGYKAYAPLGISHGGMNSKLYIRGLENGELVLINGAPIQGAAGHAYDLNTIPIDQIERVEILKGAASALYGADAMTGVINIVTKKPSAETKVKASVEFGNESYHNHTISASFPKVNIGLNYQHLGALEEISRSFSQKYRYDQDASDKYSLNLNANPFENVYLDYLGSYYETGFKKYYDGNTKPYEGTDQKHFKNFFNLRYEARNFKAKAFSAYDEMRRDEYTGSDPEDKNKNYNYGLEGDYRLDLSWLEFVVGTDYIYRGANYNNQYGKHHRNDYALFAQLKKEFFNRLILTAGAREQFIDGESGTRNYNRFLPSFGATFKATRGLNLFANAGKAFRAPTFNNLYYESSFLVGNPDLDPEGGWTYESGVKYDTKFLRLRFSGFYMTYKDKIEIDRSKGYPLTYFNAGDYETKGVEWELDLYPFIHGSGFLADVSPYMAGYWADPKAEDTAGQEYQAGPKFQTSIGIAYSTELLTLDLNSQILNAREKDLDDYAVLNFYGKYKFWKGYLTFTVDNIFDDEVQVSGDLSADASNQYVYYDVGRLFKVGYEITF
jgi:iron complex outermembrane receptor protein